MKALNSNVSNSGCFSNMVITYEGGVSAFRNGDFKIAVDCFRHCLKLDSQNWDAEMFLAMSLVQVQQHSAAITHFRTISEWCPNHVLRNRANLALQALRG